MGEGGRGHGGRHCGVGEAGEVTRPQVSGGKETGQEHRKTHSSFALSNACDVACALDTEERERRDEKHEASSTSSSGLLHQLTLLPRSLQLGSQGADDARVLVDKDFVGRELALGLVQLLEPSRGEVLGLLHSSLRVLGFEL